MPAGWKFFSVKTIYVSEAKGKLKKRLRPGHDPKSVLVEERVVLVGARNPDEALRKTEQEAQRYAEQGTVVNPYGQEVTRRYSGVADCYELFLENDAIEAGAEVFSSTRILPRSPSNEALADLFLGPEEPGEQERLKFLSREFSGEL